MTAASYPRTAFERRYQTGGLFLDPIADLEVA